MKDSKVSSSISKHIITEESLPKNIVKLSYSQYSIYKQCPHRWYKQYGLKDYRFTSSIDTVFGTAFHETVQEYLSKLYNISVKASEEFDIESFLHDKMINCYKEEVEKNDKKHFTTPELLNEYYEDGCAILKWIKNKRKVFFDTKNVELVGIEIPILIKINETNDTLYFKGYLDLVFYNKEENLYEIIDLKTSKAGWNAQIRKSQDKIDQLLLYKKYFSNQFKVPEENINVQFHIVKRKIIEDSEYPQPRLSKFEPANGKNKVKEAIRGLDMFIYECFDYDGNIQEKYYRKNPGTNNNNCRFCPYTNECNKKNSK